MATSARLQQLGLPDFIPNGQRTATNSKDKNKTNERNREDADYDPLHDDTGEQDLFDDDIAKVMVLPSYGFDLHDDNNTMADGADVIAQPVGVNQMTNEGGEVPWNRGTNMGHGQIRPLVPLIAAKYATEINIAVRNHIPVLTHWKEYKDHAEIEEFLGILRVSTFSKAFPLFRCNNPYFLYVLPSQLAKFNIDTNDAVVKNGCLEMMRNGMIYQKNKDNRGNVLLHQTTGSCSYPVFVENLDEDTELNAFDLFKMCHFSKKKDGYTPAVQSAITQMETQLAAQPTQGEQPKSAVQVVASVLEHNNKKSVFLQNVGMQTKRPRMSAQLEAEKRENAELRLIQVQETEQTRIRDKEEMSKKQAELEAKLELVLDQNGSR
ncbi:hypothetical protein GQ55_8G198900 [Panicum hallii var. hallii]|uniref:Uncharacterized protein n=1 Tax=Panicum hallii var. hallii TaxID=1504633 RepID=A0A2T7CP94_9POAL|nr:hypothetical protein GQ55_8G198900 [Panicum hallii var. hallii]